MFMTIRHQTRRLQRARVLAAGLLLSAAASGFAGTVTYTVGKDDTLWRVASKHGTSVEALRKLNGLKGNTIAPGQKLIVATNGKTSSAKTAHAAVASKPAVKETLRSASSKPVAKPVPVAAKPASGSGPLQLASSAAIVVDASTGQTLFSKNADVTRSIASITKLMTAMVVLDANPSMQETITVSDEDVDYLKNTTSRLPVGTRLTRYEMLRLALMSSENRASSALSRHYPGGQKAFLAAMNQKAARLGMKHTQFYDPTGLTPRNVSTAEDLVKMVQAASQYDLIREFSTTPGREVALRPHSTPLQYKNSNALVRGEAGDWNIRVSKTGYTQEAGRCLVMMAMVANRPAVMVMLDSDGKLSPVGDANRLKDWIESGRGPVHLASR